MGTRMIFSRGGIQGYTLFLKKVDDFLVVTLKTWVFTVATTGNAQNTLQHFRGRWGGASKCPQNTGKHRS